MIKAVLLDRDGTINIDKGYVYKLQDFEFLPGAIDALKRIYKNDFRLFVVTNQSGLALNYYTFEDMEEVHRYLLGSLHKEGVEIEKIYICPHHPKVSICNCRKPEPGMLERAISEFNIDVTKSYMIGDKNTDIEAGRKVHLKTILLGKQNSLADCCCCSLLEAADIILGVKS